MPTQGIVTSDLYMYYNVAMGAGGLLLASVFGLGMWVNRQREAIDKLTTSQIETRELIVVALRKVEEEIKRKADKEMTDLQFKNNDQRLEAIVDEQQNLALSIQNGFREISGKVDKLTEIVHHMSGKLDGR